MAIGENEDNDELESDFSRSSVGTGDDGDDLSGSDREDDDKHFHWSETPPEGATYASFEFNGSVPGPVKPC